MKSLLSIVAIAVLGVFYVSGANADEPQASSQSKYSRYKQITEKFDKNNDGKLDERERAEVRKYFSQRYSRYSQERTTSTSRRPSIHRPTHCRTHGHPHPAEVGMKRWVNQWPRNPRGADKCDCDCCCACCKNKRSRNRRRPHCGTG